MNSTVSQNLQHSFSHGLIEFNSDPIKDYSDHILREFSLYNPIVLDYLWDLLNSVIGKNCNLFRNISKSFPELSNFITQSLNVESHRPFWYAKSAFEIFSPFSIFDRYSFTFSILYSAVYFFPSILVPPSTSGNPVNIRMYLDIIENISKTREWRNWKGIEKARENTHKRNLLNQWQKRGNDKKIEEILERYMRKDQ